jgi:hypothetical protein
MIPNRGKSIFHGQYKSIGGACLRKPQASEKVLTNVMYLQFLLTNYLYTITSVNINYPLNFIFNEKKSKLRVNISAQTLFNLLNITLNKNEKSITFSLVSLKLWPIASANGI